MQIYVAVIFLGLVGVCAGAETKWNYSDPSNWRNNFLFCGKSSQSPINIKNPSCDVKLNNSIETDKYNETGNGHFTLLNNGHTLQLNADTTGANIKLAKNGDVYKLAQLHFHWGKDNKKGSEHALNGKHYPAEMQLVHYNDKFSSVEDAKNQTSPMALAVLSVFIQVGTNTNLNFAFLDSVMKIVEVDTNVTVKPFAMDLLLPENRDVFYRYNGSLTTPPCYESVIWTVFRETVKISQAQLSQLRALNDSNGGKLENNFRPVQELKGHKITYWDKNECSKSGALVLGASVLTVLLSVLLFFSV